MIARKDYSFFRLNNQINYRNPQGARRGLMREAGCIMGPIINEEAKILFVFLHIEINKLHFIYRGL
jgi:hypothetical protein